MPPSDETNWCGSPGSSPAISFLTALTASGAFFHTPSITTGTYADPVAAATVAAFNGLVRVADGTGIKAEKLNTTPREMDYASSKDIDRKSVV